MLLSVLLSFGTIYLINKNNQEKNDNILPTPVVTRFPKKTNSWFSGLYTFPSTYIHALPGMYKVVPEGITFATANAVANENSIISAYGFDCVIGFEKEITNTVVSSYGDWNVNLEIKNDSTPLAVATITQGSPILSLTNIASQSLNLNCSHPYTIQKTQWGSVVQTSELRYLFNDYNLEQNQQTGITTFTVSDQRSLFVTILPKQADLSDLSPYLVKHNIKNTKASFEIKKSDNNPNLQVLVSMEIISEEEQLTSVWPHQQPQYDLAIQNNLGSYVTTTGTLYLIKSNAQRHIYTQPSLPLSFETVKDRTASKKISDSISRDWQTMKKLKLPDGVYFRGTEIGALASLTDLAFIYDNPNKNDILKKLTDELQYSWQAFHYDSANTLYVSSFPEFGHEKGNDHHFHYGYYLRAAAVAVKYNPQLLDSYLPYITEMINDIASVDSKKYPRLRSFDVFSGHSWADANANFNDGNNQESTSEALQAWYSITLWGELANKQDWQILGASLFSIELQATKAYWFGIGNDFPSGYQHKLASIVWGGKRDFATWFSGHPMHILGIQLLPITPVSAYLRSLPHPDTFSSDIALHSNWTSHEWADLYLSFLSFHNPQQAKNYLDTVSTTSGIKLHSLLLQTIYSNLE